MAAALAVVGPRAACRRGPHWSTIAFNAFHSGLQVACIAGAGVAVLGALVAAKLLPGRGAPEVQLAGGRGRSGDESSGARVRDRDPSDRRPRSLSGVRALRQCVSAPEVLLDEDRARRAGRRR